MKLCLQQTLRKRKISIWNRDTLAMILQKGWSYISLGRKGKWNKSIGNCSGLWQFWEHQPSFQFPSFSLSWHAEWDSSSLFCLFSHWKWTTFWPGCMGRNILRLAIQNFSPVLGYFCREKKRNPDGLEGKKFWEINLRKNISSLSL